MGINHELSLLDLEGTQQSPIYMLGKAHVYLS